MDWTIIISSIGGSAVLFGILAFLTRSIFVHFLDKDVENFKNALQLRAIEHQVRFNSLHAKRAEAIIEFYQKLTVVNLMLETLKNSEDETFSEKDKQTTGKIFKFTMEAMAFFKKNELLFDDALCSKVEKLYKTVCIRALIFTGMAHEWEKMKDTSSAPAERDKQIEKAIIPMFRDFGKEIPDLLNALKKQFREILGVPQTA
jgi:hypothetical protein